MVRPPIVHLVSDWSSERQWSLGGGGHNGPLLSHLRSGGERGFFFAVAGFALPHPGGCFHAQAPWRKFTKVVDVLASGRGTRGSAAVERRQGSPGRSHALSPAFALH